MSTCSVCEKQIPDGATHCGINCINADLTRNQASISQSRSNFIDSVNKMLKMEDNPTPIAELPYIILKHRWKKNRSEDFGDIIVAFDNDGVAKVPNKGNNSLLVNSYVSMRQGLVEIMNPVEVIEEPIKPKSHFIISNEYKRANNEPEEQEIEQEIKQELSSEVNQATETLEEPISVEEESSKDSDLIVVKRRAGRPKKLNN